ncbi:MAG: phosphatase PAP2 family protein [Acidimicrobiia bacterium]|nr:phosphatase PAP2 family protein [Acidimicrobiia bacterium]
MSVATLPVPVQDRIVPAPRLRQAQVLAVAIEVALVAGFYQWYSVARFWVGGSAATAQRNAMHVIGWERALGIFNESTVQAAVLAHPALMRAAGTYYGTAHFIVPAVALVLLYRRDRTRYVVWRNALAWTSVLAIAAFALFPLMPPRLLPSAFHFTNVMAPGVDRPLVPALYNGFAAMPSLHAAYAVWAALALWPVLRSRWTRALLVGHFVAITTVVIVTANHFYLDLVGGLVVLALGVLIARQRGCRRVVSPGAAAVLLVGAATLIWLPRAATLPLTLDIAAATGLAWLALATRRSPVPTVQ